MSRPIDSKVYFVSGHRDVTPDEFNYHYVPALLKAYKEGAVVVVGDYYGVDAMAQQWLKRWGVFTIVYHMFESPRNNCGLPTKGGFHSDEARDSAMTLHSDEDIAWVRPGKESSGTAQNLARRKRFSDNNT